MSDTPVGLEVVLGIDEGQSPLVKGLRIQGRVVSTVPPSRALAKRFAIIEPIEGLPSSIRGQTVYVSIRYKNGTWNNLREPLGVVVNVSLLDEEEEKFVVWGLGTLRLREPGS